MRTICRKFKDLHKDHISVPRKCLKKTTILFQGNIRDKTTFLRKIVNSPENQ